MSWVYRSIVVSGTQTLQRMFDDGSSAVGPQLVATFKNLVSGQAGQQHSAKAQSDAAGAGMASALGGTFDTSTDPFE